MTDADDLLAAYVDGELDPETARIVEARMATDAKARRLVEMHRETSALLRSACAETVYAGGAVGLVPLPSTPIRLPRRSIGWAIAASLAAAAVGFGGGARWGGTLSNDSSRTELLADIAEYHSVLSRETDHLVEIPADRTDELTSWLGDRVGSKLSVPDLTAAGLRFAGGGMLVSGDRPVAQFMYRRDRGLPVALCIARESGPDTQISVQRDGILRLADWRRNGLEYIVVGELAPAEVRAIALAAAAQLRA